jgi:hypothetical protein
MICASRVSAREKAGSTAINVPILKSQTWTDLPVGRKKFSLNGNLCKLLLE